MNAEVFAEWLRRQGHKIYRTSGSYWYNAGPNVLQAFPYHWILSPEQSEIRELMLKNHILALRYSAPADFPEGKMSYHIVLNGPYGMDSLKQKARNGVRRGLERFSVEEISFERLAKEGWVLQADTLARQNRSRSMSKTQWESLCFAAKDLPGFHAYAAISGEELAGALIVCRLGSIYSVPYSLSHCRFLSEHVNNALFFAVSCTLLNQQDISSIFFTVQSLDAPSNIDEFKLRMGFQPICVRQNVVLHPYLRPFATPVIYNLNKKLLKHYPGNHILAKAEGILRFHFEGRRPLKHQNFPECLNNDSTVLNYLHSSAG
jgi:hypothetical protein